MSHQDLQCLLIYLYLIFDCHPYNGCIPTKDASKGKDGIVHFRNVGTKGLNSGLRYEKGESAFTTRKQQRPKSLYAVNLAVPLHNNAFGKMPSVDFGIDCKYIWEKCVYRQHILSMLDKRFRRLHFEYFSQKIGLDISCKSSSTGDLHGMSKPIV